MRMYQAVTTQSASARLCSALIEGTKSAAKQNSKWHATLSGDEQKSIIERRRARADEAEAKHGAKRTWQGSRTQGEPQSAEGCSKCLRVQKE